MATYEVFDECERIQDFRCIADECEDNCCYGWKVSVSKQNFDKYTACPDEELKARLTQLVQIDPDSHRSETFASLTLSANGCGFLADKLCSIQSKVGEEYLPSSCDTFPRVMNAMEGTLETSLDLACPEAARLVLLDPTPLRWISLPVSTRFNQNMVASDVKNDIDSFHRSNLKELQAVILSILQRRDLAVWKRLAVLGDVFESYKDNFTSRDLVRALERVRAKSLSEIRSWDLESTTQSSSDMATVIELIIGRISMDYTSPRFQQCYRDFMSGINWTMESSLEDMHMGYKQAYRTYFLPFLAEYEHVLENFLVNYVVATLFPLGSSGLRSKFDADVSTLTDQYALLCIQFAIVQLLLVGAAGQYKKEFDAAVAVRVIQSCARTFDHSVGFPKLVKSSLTDKGMFAPSALSSLYACPA